ncbi:hypothetical protein BVRB_1g005200 [Beta vulgaris subsp. vulgaris]|nr:hypothetical protein BVRB_1g005200 [Beta vulgaris subsp. vulgaris]
MERDSSTSPSRDRSEGEGRVGCGGCLMMKLPINYIEVWRKSKNYIRKSSKSCTSATATNICVGQPKQSKFHDDFRYDPLSYAQNFDEGVAEYDNSENYEHGFTSRFVTLPDSKPNGQL